MIPEARRARLDAVPSPGAALLSHVLLNLMWGGSLPATKLALASFGPFTLAAACPLTRLTWIVGGVIP